MQSSHKFTVGSAVFDERNLVSAAGLVPVMELAEQTGLSRYGDQVAAQGGAPGDGVVAAGDGPGGAQQVVGDHRGCQPGAVRGEQPVGMWASGPSIRSAKVVSTMACLRWVRSASAVGSSELVKNG